MTHLTVVPFAVAFIVALTAMPTHVYQVCAWNVGTLDTEPWRVTASQALSRARASLSTWFARHWPGLAVACVLALLVYATTDAHTASDTAPIAFALTIPDLLQRKGELAEQAKQILDAAAADNRQTLKAEEEQRFDAIHADIEQLTKTIARMQKQEEIEQSLTDSAGRRSEPNPNPTERRREESRVVRISQRDAVEGLRAWLLAGSDAERTTEMREVASRVGMNLDHNRLNFKLPAIPLSSTRSDDIKDWQERNAEQRAQGVGTGSLGGFTVPDEAMRALEVSMLAFGGMRQVATIIRTDSGAALPFPTVDDTAQKGVILGENTTATEQGVTFGQIVFDAYKYSSKYILVSVELLQDSAINVAEYIGRALGERIGRITNDHFTTGTGSAQPNGIVTASGVGKTGATGQTTTVIYDDLVDLEHSVDPAYRAGARWMFNDAVLKALKKIKIPNFSGQTDGTPLWQPGLVLGQPDTILGYPYTINQSMAVMAASAKSIVFGDLRKYLIRDVRDVTLLRLDERFAELHQVAFLAFSRHDGDLLDAGTNPVNHYANSAT